MDSCAGSNALLQEGALPVMSGWDVLREYAAVYPCVKKTVPAPKEAEPGPTVEEKPAASVPVAEEPKEEYAVPLTDQEKAVLEKMSRQPMAVDELIGQVDLPAATVLRLLTGLSLKGLVQNHPGRRVSLAPQKH